MDAEDLLQDVLEELVEAYRLPAIYDGGSHGLLHVDKDRLNADLLALLIE